MIPPRRLNRETRPRFGVARVIQLMAVGGAALVAVAFARQSAAPRHAPEPTFAKDVAPVLYKNCTTCHHPGGLGPFSLMDYDSATKKLDEMFDAVSGGVMPPWHAEGPHGVFRNDRRLSEADRQLILDWIKSGAKPGDPSALPPKPDYPTGWTMGTPDAIVSMPEDFMVPASGTIEYQYFEVPTNFTEDKWIQAIEIRPGAREVVHHVLVYAKVPRPAGVVAPPPPPRPAGSPPPQPLFIRDRQYDTPADPPRLDSLHAPPRQLGTLIGSTAPGTNVVEFEKGTALRLRAGTVLTFQMHYTAKGHEMHDRTSVGFRFAAEQPEEEILASQFINGSLVIPAGAKDVAVSAAITATQPVRIWGLLPHTHLRGTRWQYKLEKPDGTSEIILDVPHYDFNWQTYYLFDKPLEVPAGAKITSMAWYDNSTSNKHNPDPTKDVKWGDQTWEEMQYTGFLYSVPSRRLKPAGGTR
jgi:mono/diheme cytochrome c family protein